MMLTTMHLFIYDNISAGIMASIGVVIQFYFCYLNYTCNFNGCLQEQEGSFYRFYPFFKKDSLHLLNLHIYIYACIYTHNYIYTHKCIYQLKKILHWLSVALGLNICHYSCLPSADPSGGETSSSSCKWQVILSRNAKCILKYTKGI